MSAVSQAGWRVAASAGRSWWPVLLFFLLAGALGATIQPTFAQSFQAGQSGQTEQFGLPPRSITVVMDDNYPPYVFRAPDGKVQGLLVDEWKLWSKRTGVEVSITATDWDKAKQIMLEGKADVIDTIFYSDERAKIYDFTKPYARLDVPVFHSRSLSGIADPGALKGFTIGVKAGDECINVLAKSGVTSVKEFDSYEDIIKAARRQEIKVFAMDKPPALYYLYKYGLEDSFSYAFTLYTGEFHRAVKKGRTSLLNLVEQGFADIPASQMQALQKKWLGTPLVNSRTRNALEYGLGGVCAVLLALMGFNLVLRRRVRSKTAELNALVAELERSEERWQFALEGSGDGVWDWNVSTGEVFFSPRWKTQLGYADEEVGHSITDWESRVHPDDLPAAREELRKHFSGETSLYFLEHRLRCKDGGWKWILARGKVLSRAPDGTPLRMLGTHTDINERKHMQEMMVQTEKMMSVGGLAAGMAHEINNPLASIMQSVQVVLRRVEDDNAANREAASRAGCTLESVRTYLDTREVLSLLHGVRDAGKRASAIVASMLEFSRKSDFRQEPVNLTELLDKTVDLCSNDYDLARKYDFRKVDILREYDPGLPPVPCAASQIEQVVMNLLRNAAHALAGGTSGGKSPRIVLRAHREEDMARIEIEDNGPGMSEELRRKVFEPFYTTKQPGEGTGLGLSVSYYIVTSNHGGSIDLETQPGKGAKFIIKLPLKSQASRMDG